MTKVINLNNVPDIECWLKNTDNVYIGREKDFVKGSKWGNPYKVKKNNGRKKVVLHYEKYIRGKKNLYKCLNELKGKTLGCWCVPKFCHGTILQRLAVKTSVVSNMSTSTDTVLDSVESGIPSTPTSQNEPSSSSSGQVSASVPSEEEDLISKRTREMLEFFNQPLNDSDIVVNGTSSPQNEPEATAHINNINSQLQIITNIQQQLSIIQGRLNDVVGAYNVLRADHNILQTQFKNLQVHSNDHNILQTQFKNLQVHSNYQSKLIYDLENDLSHFQQYNRRENIEIMGIPNTVTDSELEAKVVSILNSLGCNISSYEIVACHRLKKKNTNQSFNTIVRFTNRKIAYYALRNRKQLKWTYPSYPNLFVVENLCPRYKSIFDKCLELKREGKIKYVWSYNGVVHYKTPDEDNGYGTKVFHMSELNRSFGIHPQTNGNVNSSGGNG